MLRSSNSAGVPTNKKDEDLYDLESGAALPGAGGVPSSGSRVPFAALVRRAPPPLRRALGAARRLDRAAAVLDRRPGARLALLLYFLLLHLYLLLW
jgi:hypothetical protein